MVCVQTYLKLLFPSTSSLSIQSLYTHLYTHHQITSRMAVSIRPFLMMNDCSDLLLWFCNNVIYPLTLTFADFISSTHIKESISYSTTKPCIYCLLPYASQFPVALASDKQYYTNKVEHNCNHFASSSVKCIACCRYCHNFSRYTFVTITIFCFVFYFLTIETT